MSLGEFVLAYRDGITALFICCALVVLLVMFWERVSLWWMNLTYSFPFIGKIDKLSKDPNQESSGAFAGWFKSERVLCADYRQFVRILDEKDWINAKEYMRKAGDAGRSSLPLTLWFVIFAIVFVEAMGFSYVLAGYTIPGASENLQRQASVGVAFLISVSLVALTHLSGHQLHRSSVLLNARKLWINLNTSRKDGEKYPWFTRQVDLSQNQNLDDGDQFFTQAANRIGTFGSVARYPITILTCIFVVLVAVGATYVRGQVLESELISETAPGAGAQSYYQDQNLPAAVTAEQQKVDDKARDEGNASARKGGWGTFIVLAVIFVFLQILGVIFGHRWGFAGNESHIAFRQLGKGKYDTFEEVKAAKFDRLAAIAQSKLESLQHKIQERVANEGLHVPVNANSSFLRYLQLTRQSAAQAADTYRQEPPHNNEKVPSSAPTVQSTESQNASVPVMRPATQVAQAEPATEVSTPSPGGAAPSAEARYKYLREDGSETPTAFSIQQLRQLRAAQKINNDTLVRNESGDDFVPLSSLLG